jgi:hypothetical protein
VPVVTLKLMAAALALEDPPAGVLVARHTAAARADGLAVGSRPAIDRNMALASDARESVRALAEGRKCCDIAAVSVTSVTNVATYNTIANVTIMMASVAMAIARTRCDPTMNGSIW